MANQKNKDVEKHITVLEGTHDMLRELAKAQHRSMRGCVTVLIEEAMKKEKAKK